MWILLIAHLGLELTHRYDTLWVADVPLFALFAWHWIAWQPWKARRPGLLAALHLAFAWLPVAFALFSAQSLIDFLGHGFLLGRAPVHALAIGFFGSMLVAMVTRVTQGHAGRPLEDGTDRLVLLRRRPDRRAAAYRRRTLRTIMPSGSRLPPAHGSLAFLPWVLRSAWIYLTPRADGKPG